jgi:zinc transporter ZupT
MIDGLAVGVAFSLGNPNEFIPVVIGIVAHEIPREMGDVSILMKSNFSDREIILSNGFVNCISIVGVILGLNSMVIPPTIKQYILVFVGGNFMYIAADIWKNLFRQKSGILNILEILGFAVGVYVSLGDTCGHSHSH